MIKKVLIMITIVSCLFNVSFAIQDILPLQGNVFNKSGAPITSGNIQVLIYDKPIGGNLIYNSSNDFNNKISNGKYDILLGSGSNNLSLIFGKIYYLDLLINGENINFSGNDRQMFQSTVGKIKRLSSDSLSGDDGLLTGGFQSNASDNSAIALGHVARATGQGSIALGWQAKANGTRSISIGNWLTSSGIDSLALGSWFNVIGNGSVGINLNNSATSTPKVLKQSNTFSVIGGNSGFGTTNPKRTVQIKGVMRLEPRNIEPLNPSLGDIYVNNVTEEICFYNGESWQGLTGRLCDANTYIGNVSNLTIYLGEYEALKLNKTGSLYQLVDVINSTAAKFRFNNEYKDEEYIVYLNQSSSYYYSEIFKATDIFASNNPMIKGYVKLHFSSINDENIQNGNNLYLAEGSNGVYLINTTKYNFSNIIVDHASPEAMITINNDTKVISVNESQTFAGSLWTLNSIHKSLGALGIYFINITKN